MEFIQTPGVAGRLRRLLGITDTPTVRTVATEMLTDEQRIRAETRRELALMGQRILQADSSPESYIPYAETVTDSAGDTIPFKWRITARYREGAVRVQGEI